jgi:hypothetical protein
MITGALFRHFKVLFIILATGMFCHDFLPFFRLNGYLFRCGSCLEEWFSIEGEWMHIFESGPNKIVG